MEVTLRPEPATDAVLSLDCVGFRCAKWSEDSEISDQGCREPSDPPFNGIQFQFMNPTILGPACVDVAR
jgi:hypothetical protein